MRIKTKIRLLAMSKAAREKRLDELNQKLRISDSTGVDQEEMEEREWLKKKLGYEQH